MLTNAFSGKEVIVTGHTGFKGSWLTTWLTMLGAKVKGFSLAAPSDPSHYEVIDLSKDIKSTTGDLRNREAVDKYFERQAPDFVFHLAAQPLVGRAYSNPAETYDTNLGGTLNVLEALRKSQKPCVALFVTSDKCYENREWIWGYRENDQLGGSDPYSSSKACAELVIQSYVKSFFATETTNCHIGVGRAGNVIGGGDWSQNRIIPDCMRAWSENKPVQLRHSRSTRPWQHVLEPLSGYLVFAASLGSTPSLHGEAINFGPATSKSYTVLEVVQEFLKYWELGKGFEVLGDSGLAAVAPQEAGLLRLNCEKAMEKLLWCGVLNFQETVKFTTDWYQSYYARPENAKRKTQDQIVEFVKLAQERGVHWAQ